jgi:hypothetical protein
MNVPPRRSTRFEYPPVGRCIYCGRDDVELTLEHIIPESLDGVLELPDASCAACQKIINRGYEWTIGRTMFGDFRIRHNIRSKRPKAKRPTTIRVEFQKADGSSFTETLSRKDYPAPLFMYKLGAASIMRGLPPGTGIFEWLPYVIASDKEMKELVAKHGANSVHRVKMVPVELARTLAKIGHSFAVAEFGWGSFDPLPQNIDTILCRTDDVAYTVGGDMELSPAIPDAGHVVSGRIWLRPLQSPLLIMDIRLFASIDTPNFHVAVGTFDIEKPQHLVAFTEQLRTGEPIGTP